MATSPVRKPARAAAAKTGSDRSALIYVLAGVLLMLVGFAAAWFFQQSRHEAALARLQTTYAAPVPVVTMTSDHSLAAKLVIRTSVADAAWVEANRKALEQVFTATLAAADMQQARAPGGMRALQERLREAGNAALRTNKLQEVLLTDFLVGETSD